MPEVGKVCQTDESAFAIAEAYLKATNTTIGGMGTLGKREVDGPRGLDRLMV